MADTKTRAIGKERTAFDLNLARPWRYKASHIMPENVLMAGDDGVLQGLAVGSIIPAGTLMALASTDYDTDVAGTPTTETIDAVAPFIEGDPAQGTPYGILESDYVVEDIPRTVPVIREGWFLYNGVKAWDTVNSVYAYAEDLVITQAPWTALGIHLE